MTGILCNFCTKEADTTCDLTIFILPHGETVSAPFTVEIMRCYHRLCFKQASGLSIEEYVKIHNHNFRPWPLSIYVPALFWSEFAGL